MPATNPQVDSGPESTPETHPAYTTLDSGAGRVAGSGDRMKRLNAGGPPAHANGTGTPITTSHCVSIRTQFQVAHGPQGEWSDNEALGKQQRLAP